MKLHKINIMRMQAARIAREISPVSTFCFCLSRLTLEGLAYTRCFERMADLSCWVLTVLDVGELPYPNPTSGLLHVRVVDPHHGQLHSARLLDLHGRVLQAVPQDAKTP
jgi:hypothetical protein